MKLTNLEIFNAREPLGQLMKEKLPVKTSYGLAKMAAKLNDQLKVVDDVRNGLIRTYGAPDPNSHNQIAVRQQIEQKDAAGQIVMVDNPQFPKFMAEMGELMHMETEIVFEKVKLPDTLEIPATVVMALDKFITI